MPTTLIFKTLFTLVSAVGSHKELTRIQILFQTKMPRKLVGFRTVLYKKKYKMHFKLPKNNFINKITFFIHIMRIMRILELLLSSKRFCRGLSMTFRTLISRSITILDHLMNTVSVCDLVFAVLKI